MTQARDYARAGGDKNLIHRVAGLLQQRWAPAAEFAAPDGERNPIPHAQTILLIRLQCRQASSEGDVPWLGSVQYFVVRPDASSRVLLHRCDVWAVDADMQMVFA